MSEYSFFEKWAAVPWLNGDTSQALGPMMPANNYADVMEYIEKEKAKKKRNTFLKVLLGVGLAGGAVVGGSKLMDAARARQAAEASKIVRNKFLGNAAKGLGSAGLIAAAILGGKALMNKGDSGPSRSSSNRTEGLGLPPIMDILQSKIPRALHRQESEERRRNTPMRNPRNFEDVDNTVNALRRNPDVLERFIARREDQTRERAADNPLLGRDFNRVVRSPERTLAYLRENPNVLAQFRLGGLARSESENFRQPSGTNAALETALRAILYPYQEPNLF